MRPMRCSGALVANLLVIGSAAVAAACSFDGSNVAVANDSAVSEEVDATLTGSDATDERPDAQLGCQNFASLFDACAQGADSGDLALTEPGTYVFNTDSGVLVNPDGEAIPHESIVVAGAEEEVRVLLAESFTLGTASALRGVGALPLGIASHQTLSIEGVIDVGRGGAGARNECGDSSGSDGENQIGGAGGGGGGGFQGSGGSGGEGNADGTTGVAGAGGDALGQPLSPRGGCPGGEGGRGEDPEGAPGVAGGAVYLTSGVQIVISGGVQAGGGGGQGGRETGLGPADSGGGGGGSGGYIMLEAPTVTISGAVAANGGGGGEGSGDGDQGNDGGAGTLNAIPAAGGGGGSPTGAQGAAGSAGADLVGPSVTESENGGGGGGGGGAGFIIVDTANASLSGIISPPAL